MVLAWLLAKGAAAIPKASSKEHLQTNLGAVDVTLEDEDIATIDGLPVEKRYVDWPGKHFDF